MAVAEQERLTSTLPKVFSGAGAGVRSRGASERCPTCSCSGTSDCAKGVKNLILRQQAAGLDTDRQESELLLTPSLQ